VKRFDAMVQDVAMLSHQLTALGDRPGNETRMLIQERLWAIIADLDERLSLNLDNHCLDLAVVKDRLCIHFWTGLSSLPEVETSIYIDKHLSVTRHIKDLSTGILRIWALKGSPPSVIWVEK
jgi:hypothetical protein